ncbi:MAG: hypothetical protein GY909_10830 [Oligoflexia bacterium]|nr:hypothetical protein [Oligoflexia bacterium]
MKNLIVATLSIFLFSCASINADTQDHGPRTVDYVDIKQYMGLWYEVGRYANSFQKKCGQTTAEYSLTKKGKVKVVNTCKRLDKPGKLQVAKAIAKVKDKKTNAKLKVSFVPLLKYLGWFAGDYWIIALGDNYEYALVGDKNRKFLWILSRTPELPEQTIDMILDIAEREGFDRTKFNLSPTWQD